MGILGYRLRQVLENRRGLLVEVERLLRLAQLQGDVAEQFVVDAQTALGLGILRVEFHTMLPDRQGLLVPIEGFLRLA